jgi:ferric-dicitrate binding protein FerR (iron transport regulator)
MLRSEDYVRPATVAVEPPSARARAWRLRAVLAIALLVVLAAVIWLARALVPGGEGSPDVGHAGSQVRHPVPATVMRR